ncbi:MAG TPA: nuclear transport factor 2 family protein [Thermoanaerobaculia bacterium]|nr:nuclear transport factor 2 family protein [Thermoanaerobaculia bacterium]
MKTTIVLAIALALAGCARNDNSEQLVLRGERQLWDAWKHRDRATFEKLTAPDYACVSEDGVLGLEQIRTMFATAHLSDYRLGKMVARRISADSIVVVYNAHMVGEADGKDVSRGVSEASVWARRGGEWRNVLLHEVTRSTREAGVDP